MKSFFLSWGLWGVAATLLVGLLPLWLLKRNRKALLIEEKTRVPVVSIHRSLANEVVVLYKGEAVNEVSLSVFRIENTGKYPILASDFDKAISINTDKASLLSSTLKPGFPGDLALNFTQSEHSVSVEPVLLNQGDWFELNLLTNARDPQISVSVRVVGVPKIDLERRHWFSTVQNTALVTQLLLSLFGLVAVVVHVDVPWGYWLLVGSIGLISYLLGKITVRFE